MEIKQIKLKIDNMDIIVDEKTTILNACKKHNIYIPTLCHLDQVHKIGMCKVCVVEVKGLANLVVSCILPVREGMEIFTNSPKVIEARRNNLYAILKKHNWKCLSCVKNNSCDLQRVSAELRCEEGFFNDTNFINSIDNSSSCVVRDDSKCILCQRCIAVCTKMQAVGALIVDRTDPTKPKIASPENKSLNDSACVGCGQCTLVCPTAAFMEKNDTEKVMAALNDPEIITVVAPAPSARVSIGESFNFPIGTNVEGKLVTSLRRLGFNYVFDVDFGADMTIVEEANELVDRIKNNKNLPMFTSCCPGWVNYLTYFYPEFIPNLSTSKSPVQMIGSAIKSYWAEKNKFDPKKVFFVSIMPCSAKKSEITKGLTAVKGLPDTDAIITVRELSWLLKRQGILLNKMEDSEFDNPLGESTGAGVIFGATGGVMEAAVRTAADALENKNLEKLEYNAVRGTKGIKETVVNLSNNELRLCVVSGLANAKIVLDQIKSGEKKYDFIEVMACPGGCVNGGGMPVHDYDYENTSPEEISRKRASGLYKDDLSKKIRKSHLNPSLVKMYDEYFGKPLSHTAHLLLHTSFKARNK